MQKCFRSILVITHYEWIDAMRSRRAVVWILFFILSAAISSSIFIYTITKIEEQIAGMIRASPGDRPGTLTSSVWESDIFLEQITPLVGDSELARTLLKTPPLTLFYGWFTLWATPLLVIILSCESISSDLSTGSARFIIFRVSRLSWCIGKAFSQAMLLAVALVLGAVCVWSLGAWGMTRFNPVLTATTLAAVTGKTWFYSLAFLGLALGISQSTHSINLSRSLGLLLFILIAVLSIVSDHYSGEGWSRIWELVHVLTPQAHRVSFWRPGPVAPILGAVYTTGLGILYFTAGHLILSRKDL